MPHVADYLAADDMLPGQSHDRHQVPIDGMHIVPVIDDDLLAITAAHIEIRYVAVACGANRRAIWSRDINAGMKGAFPVERVEVGRGLPLEIEGVVFRVGTRLEPDPEVPPGDVHVTTQRGLLVRDVEQALASIAERIEGDQA